MSIELNAAPANHFLLNFMKSKNKMALAIAQYHKKLLSMTWRELISIGKSSDGFNMKKSHVSQRKKIKMSFFMISINIHKSAKNFSVCVFYLAFNMAQ